MEAQNLNHIRRRRTRERLLVALACVLLLLFGFLEGWFIQLESELPLFGNILLLAFVNINVVVLLLLAYLVLRNIVKLIFERKRNILGSRLKTRLIAASVGLTLIPTIPMFWLASKFIFSSLDNWFSARVEHSLEQSVSVAKHYLDKEKLDLAGACRLLKEELEKGWVAPHDGSPVPAVLSSGLLLDRYRLDSLLFYDRDENLVWSTEKEPVKELSEAVALNGLLQENEASARVVSLSKGGRQAVAVRIGMGDSRAGASAPPNGDLIAFRMLSSSMSEDLGVIKYGYDKYLQIKMLHLPLKKSHFITFSIVTVMAIFAAVWFGFFVAKNLTVPIQALVEATRRVAEGDLDVRLGPERQDEIGMLMESFNQMILDLKEGREKLAGAYEALQVSNLELEERRRYMEIVLKNVAAGVVSVDASGNIMTMNKPAEALFGIKAGEVRGSHYSKFLEQPHLELVRNFMDTCRSTGQLHFEQQAHVTIGSSPMTLMVKASMLRGERGEDLGVVVVLDDFTEIEKAQRMAAWREVARRIAHEIKNPLTPIQLSAQRLRRKHPELIGQEGSVFDECTRVIIQQVDLMKHLVNEFSKFARLPRASLAPADLSVIVEEGLSLYRHNFSRIEFQLEKNGEMPLLRLDRDQFRQVMLNLLENAVHAVGEEGGSITVRLGYDEVLKIATLECADTGHGIASENRLRVFEPYFSTKEKGMGLGLAIVASIVADHNGFIRVRDNVPRGAVIAIELPG
jgi:two-component system, NtrC family, nitrogen regulation sensor histidine kinase NtrY